MPNPQSAGTFSLTLVTNDCIAWDVEQGLGWKTLSCVFYVWTRVALIITSNLYHVQLLSETSSQNGPQWVVFAALLHSYRPQNSINKSVQKGIQKDSGFASHYRIVAWIMQVQQCACISFHFEACVIHCSLSHQLSLVSSLGLLPRYPGGASHLLCMGCPTLHCSVRINTRLPPTGMFTPCFQSWSKMIQQF